MSSSPLRAGASLEQELDYYKKQYEQLETDLADFQASSKELEEQLERDIDVAEKSERKLKEQVEKLSFEVEEWRTKHKQAKTEANSAQNALQKEITTMRETTRSLQLKLRDIEVANDDYERQARHTESSLEDLESKYNVAIERDVLLEEEIKNGEQEREALRIETQRLRDELGDLNVESEITITKLRLADATIERMNSRKPNSLAVESLRARSPASEASGITPGSPTASTPPSRSDNASDAPTPPSPPLSDAPASAKAHAKTPVTARRASLFPDSATMPRQSLYGPRAAPRHARAPSVASSNCTSASDARAMKPPPATKPRHASVSRPSKTSGESLPRSDSLYQIKALRGRMQKIEERVQSARSKLPPPGSRTPTSSPHSASALGETISSSVTMRRSVRRPSAVFSSSLANDLGADEILEDVTEAIGPVKRLSYGISRPASSAAGQRPPSRAMERPASRAMERPPSRAMERPASRAVERPVSRAVERPASRAVERPPSRAVERPQSRAAERPASRAMERPASRAAERPPSRASASATSRPSSRASMASASNRPSSRAGARTALDHHRSTVSTTPTHHAGEPARPKSSMGGPGRPRSSVGGNYATIHGTPRGHRPSASVSEVRRRGTESETGALPAGGTSSSRRTTMERLALSTTPSKLPARESLGGVASSSPGKTTPRRISMGVGGWTNGEMRPPPSRRKMSDVGETY